MTDGIDTDERNPAATLLMRVMAAFAEFEASLINERTTSGRAEYDLAFADGKVGVGKRESKSRKNLPSHRPKQVFRRDLAKELREGGMSWRNIEKELNVPQSTIRRFATGLSVPKSRNGARAFPRCNCVRGRPDSRRARN